MSMNLLDQIRVKHGQLVDKKFLHGLTKKESEVLAQINRILDASEEKYYAQMSGALAARKEALLAETQK